MDVDDASRDGDSMLTDSHETGPPCSPQNMEESLSQIQSDTSSDLCSKKELDNKPKVTEVADEKKCPNSVSEDVSFTTAKLSTDTSLAPKIDKTTPSDFGSCTTDNIGIKEKVLMPGQDTEGSSSTNVPSVPKEDDHAAVHAGTPKKVRVLKPKIGTDDQPVGAPSVVDDADDNKDEEDTDPMMGYDFNEEGRLCDKDGKAYEFNFYEDQWRNQQRYNRLGEAVTEKVYDLLERRCKLQRLNLPLDVVDTEPHSFIFISNGAFTTTDRLLILIHGSGVVRAGQWTRRLIINDGLAEGTQIPYIEWALKEGYEVMVLNTNLNYWPDGNVDNSEPIPENQNPEAHTSYVWKHLISPKVKAQHIAIVAHSYGGVVTTHLLTHETEEFTERVFAVAFTDSVHSVSYNAPSAVGEFYAKHARNYVTSDRPLDEPMLSSYSGRANAERLSAGHTKHEWTSFSSMVSIFEFLKLKYANRTSDSSAATL